MITVLQEFTSSTSRNDNFTQSNPAAEPPIWANAGLNGSPALFVESATDHVQTTKQSYTVSDDAEYSVSMFFNSRDVDGYGALGFSTQSQDTNAGSYGAPGGTHFGVFIGKNGGGLNNVPIDTTGAPASSNMPITWNNSGIQSNGNWYKAVFTARAIGNDKYDLNLKIYEAASTGTIGSLVTEHSMTDDVTNLTRVGSAVTNTSVGTAHALHSFFSNEGSFMTYMDNFQTDLAGDTLLLPEGGGHWLI